MDNPLKPQPLAGEVLPGLTVVLLGAWLYFSGNSAMLSKVIDGKNIASILGGGFALILISWIIGTFLDAVRDLVEHQVDRKRPVNWPYLLQESPENIAKLNDSWLAYYFLSGNMTVGLLLVTLVGFPSAIYFGWDHVSINLAIGWLALLVVVAVFGANSWTLRKEIRSLIGSEYPHNGVYTRIRVSNAQPSTEFPGGSKKGVGVGVFAIRHIPAGTLIFVPDDDPTLRIDGDKISALPTELQELYRDFCPLHEGSYTCPVTFNKLTPAWYLNDSDSPNCKMDEHLKIRASRDIGAGEELFLRYGEFCD